MSENAQTYLLADQDSEIERLQLQSRVWEPSGKRLLANIEAPGPCRALDVGCGALGWLRLLSEWVGDKGEVVGADIDETMLAFAQRFVSEQKLTNVSLQIDDLFDSGLAPQSFDLVHARFQIAPLGRASEQIKAYKRLLRPGGWIVLEDPDTCSWRFHPEADAAMQLIELIGRGFAAAGGDLDAGPKLVEHLREAGVTARIRAEVLALEPSHPYLRLPLQFARSLRSRLEQLAGRRDLDELLERATAEIELPQTWGVTFTLIQAFGQVGATK